MACIEKKPTFLGSKFLRKLKINLKEKKDLQNLRKNIQQILKQRSLY